MPATTFAIEVQDDHLKRISQVRKPVLAVAELIWNAVDADADHVSVFLEDDHLGGIGAIHVVDDGHGIPHSQAEALFSSLGGSWKGGGRVSKHKRRILHGKEGEGRFRAFSLGRVVDWSIRYDAGPEIRQYEISMVKDRLKHGELKPEKSADKDIRPGVTVRISELDTYPRSLRSAATPDELAQIFALYLRQYPEITVVYNGDRVDPSSAEDHAQSYPLPDIASTEGENFPASVEIVEWKMRTERRLYFCDAKGFPLEDTAPGIQAPGFDFTAYLKSDYFQKLASENRLIGELDSPTEAALTSAKEVMRDHFRRRASEKSAGLVEEWRREDVYPYRGDPVGMVEEAERQVFNVVALNVNHYLPSFQEADEKTKKLQLRLLRHAIQHAPESLSKILSEVLDLPTEKQTELSEMLDRTTLSAIISASKTVADRLEFIQGLETLVFDGEFKHEVRERTQLHRIIADNAWMFGEQYNISVDDESLTEVLKSILP